MTKNIFLVMEHYDNGEYYEDKWWSDGVVQAFSTRIDAEQFINELPVPVGEFDEQYEETTDIDVLPYFLKGTEEFFRVFMRSLYGGDVVETISYTISEIPYCYN